MFTVTQKPINTQNKEELKMMYVNKKNGKVATVVSEDEKCKTVILEYEDNSTTCVTTSTLKRWWKKFEAEEVVETLDVECENGVTDDEALEQAVVDPEDAYVRELGIECPPVTSYEVVSDNEKELTDEQYAQIGKEIAEQAKKKAKTVKQSIKKTSDWVEEAKKFIYSLVELEQDEIFVLANNINMRSFKVGGHMYAKFNFSKSSITLAVKSSCLESVRKPDKTVNHMFDAVYGFKNKLSKEDKELLVNILKCARIQRVNKNKKDNK